MANGHVEKRGGSYYAIWADEDGRRHAKSLGGSEAKANRFLAARQAEVAAAKTAAGEMAFCSLATEFITRIAPARWKASTLRNAESDFSRHLVPYFGDFAVSSITTRDVDNYVSMRISEERACPSTVRGELNSLRQALDTAAAWGFASGNAAKGVKLRTVKRSEASFLRPVELARLLDAAAPEWRPYLMTASLAGLRCGELAGLLEKDVDFERHQLHVRRSVYRGRYGTTKTPSSVRSVDMPPSLEEELRTWLKSPLRKKTPKGIVFPTRLGNPVSSDSGNERGLRPALEAAGLPKIRMHDLRHTYASLLIANRESIKYVQRMLGHNSIKTTIDTYGHLLDDSNRPAAKRLDDAVWGRKEL